MAWSGCGEGYGGQNSVDRRNVQIEGSPELRNVSGWDDWRQFASVKDAAGTQLTMEEMEALPGLCIRILCTPAGMWFLLNSTSYTYVLFPPLFLNIVSTQTLTWISLRAPAKSFHLFA